MWSIDGSTRDRPPGAARTPSRRLRPVRAPCARSGVKAVEPGGEEHLDRGGGSRSPPAPRPDSTIVASCSANRGFPSAVEAINRRRSTSSMPSDPTSSSVSAAESCCELVQRVASPSGPRLEQLARGRCREGRSGPVAKAATLLDEVEHGRLVPSGGPRGQTSSGRSRASPLEHALAPPRRPRRSERRDWSRRVAAPDLLQGRRARRRGRRLHRKSRRALRARPTSSTQRPVRDPQARTGGSGPTRPPGIRRESRHELLGEPRLADTGRPRSARRGRICARQTAARSRILIFLESRRPGRPWPVESSRVPGRGRIDVLSGVSPCDRLALPLGAEPLREARP